MAQTFVYNFNEQSPQGYLKPANSSSAASPDNVTHAQLRYTDFSSSYVIQGSVVSGANSTFEFSVSDVLAEEVFKMYYSTDGTTYSVDKTFGGTSGKKLFATADLSGLVTTGTAQSITATKTVNNNANLVIASGSDITVQSGGDITLADAPTASTDVTNKAYVDARASKEALIFVSLYDPTGGTIVSATIYNTTGRTFTLSGNADGILLSFTGSPTASLFVQTFNAISDFDEVVPFGYVSGFDITGDYLSISFTFDSSALLGSILKNFPLLIKDYS